MHIRSGMWSHKKWCILSRCFFVCVPGFPVPASFKPHKSSVIVCAVTWRQSTDKLNFQSNLTRSFTGCPMLPFTHPKKEQNIFRKFNFCFFHNSFCRRITCMLTLLGFWCSLNKYCLLHICGKISNHWQLASDYGNRLLILFLHVKSFYNYPNPVCFYLFILTLTGSRMVNYASAKEISYLNSFCGDISR